VCIVQLNFDSTDSDNTDPRFTWTNCFSPARSPWFYTEMLTGNMDSVNMNIRFTLKEGRKCRVQRVCWDWHQSDWWWRRVEWYGLDALNWGGYTMAHWPHPSHWHVFTGLKWLPERVQQTGCKWSDDADWVDDECRWSYRRNVLWRSGGMVWSFGFFPSGCSDLEQIKEENHGSVS